jgi:hypothetical protein
MYRMDHAFKRHRNWLPPGQKLSKLPSEYFAAGIYTTFQDDWVAFQSVDMMNWHRLMWANDFPHSDSTWPWSQQMLAEHAAKLSDEQRRAILCDNVAELYHIDLATLSPEWDSKVEHPRAQRAAERSEPGEKVPGGFAAGKRGTESPS